MNEVVNSFAKLAGILKAASGLLKMQWNPGEKHARLYRPVVTRKTQEHISCKRPTN